MFNRIYNFLFVDRHSAMVEKNQRLIAEVKLLKEQLAEANARILIMQKHFSELTNAPVTRSVATDTKRPPLPPKQTDAKVAYQKQPQTIEEPRSAIVQRHAESLDMPYIDVPIKRSNHHVSYDPACSSSDYSASSSHSSSSSSYSSDSGSSGGFSGGD